MLDCCVCWFEKASGCLKTLLNANVWGRVGLAISSRRRHSVKKIKELTLRISPARHSRRHVGDIKTSGRPGLAGLVDSASDCIITGQVSPRPVVWITNRVGRNRPGTAWPWSTCEIRPYCGTPSHLKYIAFCSFKQIAKRYKNQLCSFGKQRLERWSQNQTTKN